jgi:hypothetical protein
MTYAENLWLFFVLLFGIIAVPGMDMLFVLANALTVGRRAGLSATAGVMTGGAVHALIGATGVGVLLKLAPSLFTLMLFAGAAYMGWVGMALVRSSIVVGVLGPGATRLIVAGLSPGSRDLPAQSQGLSVHACRVPAVLEAPIWRALVSGAGDGRHDRDDASWRLWRIGAGHRRKP